MKLDYRCPRCLDPAVVRNGELVCEGCSARYPIVCGIPDLRVHPDPYIGLEADREKALHLDERAGSLDFEGLVHHYFDITPEVPKDLAARYMTGLFETGPMRAHSCLAMIREESKGLGENPKVLEIGCGSGPFLPAIAQRFPGVVGLDIALRWLVIGRKRLQEAGCAADLVCACAENLPFGDATFDVVVAANTLEHVREAGAMLRETHRVLGAVGICVLTTPNRTALSPEPHVGLWGVGFLPRRWKDPYVHWRRGIHFEKVETRSRAELERLFADQGFDRVHFELPEVDASDLAQLGALSRSLGRIYNRARRRSFGRAFFMLFGPFFRILAHKGIRNDTSPVPDDEPPARPEESRP